MNIIMKVHYDSNIIIVHIILLYLGRDSFFFRYTEAVFISLVSKCDIQSIESLGSLGTRLPHTIILYNYYFTLIVKTLAGGHHYVHNYDTVISVVLKRLGMRLTRTINYKNIRGGGTTT